MHVRYSTYLCTNEPNHKPEIHVACVTYTLTEQCTFSASFLPPEVRFLIYNSYLTTPFHLPMIYSVEWDEIITDSEWVTIWKKAAVAHLKVLSSHSPQGTSEQQVTRTRFEPGSYRSLEPYHYTNLLSGRQVSLPAHCAGVAGGTITETSSTIL
jgi:hypothetical protein